MKKTMKKIVALGSGAVLLVSASVMGTMAYLTSQDAVTNTFTVGNVAITLDETDVDNSQTGQSTIEGRDQANSYKIFPGQTYTKDPIVHVDSKSEDCWLFVKVENEIVGIEAKDNNTVADQMKENGWTVVAENVYAYNSIAEAGDNKTVFSQFKIDEGVDNTTLATYANKKINVTAYAVQADGFTTAQAAWEASFGAEN